MRKLANGNIKIEMGTKKFISIKLNKDRYEISASTLEELFRVLGYYRFSEDGSYNNDDVIQIDRSLREEIKKQEEEE